MDNDYGQGYFGDNQHGHIDNNDFSTEEELNRLLAEEEAGNTGEWENNDDSGRHSAPEEDTPDSDDSDDFDNLDDDEDEEDNDSPESDESLLEKIRDDFVKPPSNIKAEPIFSEKDIYKIVNIMVVLDNADKKSSKWIRLTFDIGGGSVRRAMSIAKMEREEFEEKTLPILMLGEIMDVAMNEDTSANPFDVIFSIVGKVSSMGERARAKMLTQLRKISRESENKPRVSSTKAATDIEVVQEAISVIQDNADIREVITKASNAIRAVESAVHN